MKINSAVNLRTQEVYSIGQLRQLREDSASLHEIGCVHCHCPLVFVHDSITRSAYLRTKSNEKHALDCEDYFIQEERKVLYQTNQIRDGRLSSGEMRSRLRGVHRLVKDGNKLDTPSSTSKPRKPKTHSTGITTEKTVRKGIARINLKTEPDVELVDNQARRRIRMTRQLPESISRQSIGKTIGTGGFLRNVVIASGPDPRATIEIEHGGVVLPIRIRADVFQHQIGLRDRLSSLKNLLKYIGDNVILSAAVEIQPSIDGGIDAILFDENALMINNQPLAVFISIV